MSTSRLEKFIYAICSMEVSDLPAPLSRIEKLWNCLITGETPDFEPLSRNEKYLMAMLDRYDISNLPAPMSRGEKLLYKIAVGETDLSDVPGYLSGYEELLKYLIENGGISGGDFEYVLYTLNQSLSTLYKTVEKPVKSAILSGNTRVNLLSELNITHGGYGYYSPINVDIVNSVGYYNNKYLTGTMTRSHSRMGLSITPTTPNKKYLVVGVFTNNDNLGLIACDDYQRMGKHELNSEWKMEYKIINGNTGNQYIGVQSIGGETYPFDFKIDTLCITEVDDSVATLSMEELKNKLINGSINFNFYGMQSVKMPVLTTTGKNLFNKNDVSYNTKMQQNLDDKYDKNHVSSNFIKVSPKTNYYISGLTVVVAYDENKKYISILRDSIEEGTFLTPKNCKYIRLRNWALLLEDEQRKLVERTQLEYGTIETPYEPYKSNILSTSEDVVLRGIGDVKDELNVATGEMIQNIYQITLTGDESGYGYSTAPSVDTDFHGTLNIGGANLPLNKKLVAPISNRFQGALYGANKTWQCCIGGSYALHFFIPKTELETSDINGFKNWVKQQYLNGNPIKVAYVLEEKSIKTVDLTTINQDGQPTKLKTFNDISHVEIDSENITPSVDVEVATKISETLSTIEPQQLNISETQNELSQTIEEQSENTDATMMATTEIYEQTL